jgi:hypothetical protein
VGSEERYRGSVSSQLVAPIPHPHPQPGLRSSDSSCCHGDMRCSSTHCGPGLTLSPVGSSCGAYSKNPNFLTQLPPINVQTEMMMEEDLECGSDAVLINDPADSISPAPAGWAQGSFQSQPCVGNSLRAPSHTLAWPLTYLFPCRAASPTMGKSTMTSSC